MAQLLNEIPWEATPLLEPAGDTAWESVVKKRVGNVSEADRRVAGSPWIRQLCLDITAFRPFVMPPHLLPIGAMVTAQENSCRYCYGANRAYMKILGYSEGYINRIERDLHLAEIDEKDRIFIAFCRNLARSRPRPAKAERDALVASGFSPLAVQEMALLIACGCFFNRIGVMIALPPEQGFERFANGPVGKIVGLIGPVMMKAMAFRQRRRQDAIATQSELTRGPFGAVVGTLYGLPGATLVRNGVDAAFASSVLPKAAKALMFAVVARTLGCRISEAEATKVLVEDGFAQEEIDRALTSLDSPRLSRRDARLLPWVRNTVHYQTNRLQVETKAIAGEADSRVLLEAIGTAALANAMVRLAMLAQ